MENNINSTISYVIGFPPVLQGCCHFKTAEDFRTSITSRGPFGDSGTSEKKLCGFSMCFYVNNPFIDLTL